MVRTLDLSVKPRPQCVPNAGVSRTLTRMNRQESTREPLGWADTTLGRALIDEESRKLPALLAGLYGPIAVLLGPRPFSGYLDACEVVHRIQAVMPGGPAPDTGTVLVTRSEALPFDAKSVGLAVLPHVLEFSDDPYQVLREVDRVLVPEGHVVILGFNPYSLWGLRNLFDRGADQDLWGGRFYRLGRVKDWLAVLGFDPVAGSMACYLPPIQSARVRRRMHFLERAGDRWWPLLAAVYILVARKREFGMTPLAPRWTQRQALTPGLAEPIAR